MGDYEDQLAAGWIAKPPRRGPKPRKPIRKMSDRKRAEIKERATVTRPGILRDDGQACRACKQKAERGWWLEVNEVPMRSKGGDPTAPADCITLCEKFGQGCHAAYHAHKLAIRKLDPVRGCRAPVEFTRDGQTWIG